MKKEVKTIDYYGVYRGGLTQNEIKEYLRDRYNELNNKNLDKIPSKLYDKFCEIAGANTCIMIVCPCCEHQIVLHYRWDVERFADELFLGKKTYYD